MSEELIVSGPEQQSTRKRWWWVGLAALAVAGGGAAWGVASFLGTGAQPAEALPAGTLGYVSVDLDPSGSQKIQALKLARKFPSFKKEVGLEPDDDLRQWIVEEIAKEADCDVDFKRDVEPWLGSRGALAAVADADGGDPFPAFVLQVTDGDKADRGLQKLVACDTESETHWHVDGDWVVAAETQEQVDQVVEQVEQGTLADDEDFQEWTEKAGDSGILTMYAAPEVGDLIADEIEKELADAPAPQDAPLADCDPAGQSLQQLSGFAGAAATLRLTDGGVELEAVGQMPGALGMGAKHAGDLRALTTLPTDTVVAYGGVGGDMFEQLEAQLAAACGGDADTVMDSLTEMLGFDLAKEGPAIFGDSIAFSIGAGFDFGALVSGELDLPVALKTTGDKAAAERALRALLRTAGLPADQAVVRGGEDSVAISLDADYAEQVAKEGKLGSDAAFRAALPSADKATGAFYLSFDGIEAFIEGSADASGAEVDHDLDDIKPLRALGLTSWSEGEELRAELRLTLD